MRGIHAEACWVREKRKERGYTDNAEVYLSLVIPLSHCFPNIIQ
jgi:hypothetical protein